MSGICGGHRGLGRGIRRPLSVAALGLAVLAIGAPHASGQGTPSINGGITHDWVNLRHWTPGSTIAVTIGGVARNVVVDGGGNADIAPHSHGVDLVPGMVLTASDGVTTKSLTLVAVTFDSLDPATDVASGTAPPGTLVRIHLFSATQNAALVSVADGSGNWTVDFTGTLDAVAGMGGTAVVEDADFDTTWADARRPHFSVSLTNDWVFITQWQPNGSVTLTVDGVAHTVATDAGGGAFPQRLLHGVDIVPGTVVSVTQGSVTKSHTAVPVSFATLDPVTDVASGTATPGAQLSIHLNSGPTFLGFIPTTADAAGNWSVDFTGTIDVEAPMNGGATAFDDDGDGTTAEFFLRRPVVQGDLDSNWISLRDWPGNTAITVTVGGAAHILTTSAGGFASLDRQAHGVDLVPGLTLTATDGTTTKNLTLVNVTVHTLDRDTDIVAGTAPPGAQVGVAVYTPPFPGGAFQTTVADSAGNWSVDFTGSFDVRYGVGTSATVEDADGDGSSANKFLPQPTIGASLNRDWINLNQWNAGSLTLNIGGAVQTVTIPAGGGVFLNRLSHGRDLTPGMVITATQGTTTKTLTLGVTFDSLDAASNIASGTAPAGAQVQVNLHGPGNGFSSRTATAGPGGAWSVDFTGTADVVPGVVGDASVTDADQDTAVAERFLQENVTGSLTGTTALSGLAHPDSPAVGPDGDVYFAQHASADRVSLWVLRRGEIVPEELYSAQGGRPGIIGIGFDSSGDVYFALTRGLPTVESSIIRLDAAGSPTVLHSVQGTGAPDGTVSSGTWVTGLAVTPTGGVYFATQTLDGTGGGSAAVSKLEGTGASLLAQLDHAGADFISSLDVSPGGVAYVAHGSGTGPRISEIRDGQPPRLLLGPGPGALPYVGLDGDGNLLVLQRIFNGFVRQTCAASTTYRILRFAADGSGGVSSTPATASEAAFPGFRFVFVPGEQFFQVSDAGEAYFVTLRTLPTCGGNQGSFGEINQYGVIGVDGAGQQSLLDVDVDPTAFTPAPVLAGQPAFAYDELTGRLYVTWARRGTLEYLQVGAPTPAQLVSSAGATIEALAAAAQGTPAANDLENTVKKIDAALAAAGDPQAMIEQLKGAAQHLESAVADGLPAATAAPLFAQITQAARDLATAAIDAAKARSGSATLIAKAEEALATGDARRAAGNYKDAINAFKDALGKASTA